VLKDCLRIYVVIVDDVGWFKKFDILEAFDSFEKLELGLERETRGDSVRVDHRG
jgi:hypothetical protein